MNDGLNNSPGPGADREQKQRELDARMGRVRRKILVLSGKGGVGKSTVAANLAVSLAGAGKTVGLLDVDLHGPSVPTLLGLDGRRMGPAPDGGIEPIAIDERLHVVSMALLLESAGDAVIWRGPMKYNVIQQLLSEVAWGELDYLVVDSPPGTGDEPLAVAQLVGAGAEALVVTTPQRLAVNDVRRSISFCQSLNLHVLGIVENMSGMVCPHCGKTVEVFKTGGGQSLAQEMEVPFLGRVPMDTAVVAGGDSGQPFVHAAGGSAAAEAFARVVDSILEDSERPASPGRPVQPVENKTMLIAIPTTGGRLSMHFGHCEAFVLVEVDTQSRTILSSRSLTPPAHEPGVLPRWLNEQGATTIIAGGMGQRAQQLFDQAGIDVVVGAPSETPEKIASEYLEDTLKIGDNVCDH